MTSDHISTLALIRPVTILVSIRLSGLHLLQCGLANVKAWQALRWPLTLNIPCRIAQVSHLVVLASHLIVLVSRMRRKNPSLLLPVHLDLLVDHLQMAVSPHGSKCLVATFFS